MSSILRLSVIVPHLNEPGDLRRCLASLHAQRADAIPFEVIVVDNGSIELPEAVCAAFPGTRLESEAAPGPGPARNKGVSVAGADLIAFIDCDCIADPEWVRAIVRFMDDNPAIGFIGGDIAILPARPDRLTAVEAYESVFAYQAKRYLENHGYAATGNMAVRADVFRAVGPFGGIATMEDTEWGRRASVVGYSSAYLAEAKVTTGPCTSFAELARRWDRHVAHEFRHFGRHRARLLVWAARSALVSASPLAELPRILRSNRLKGLRARCLAFACLSRVRVYRAGLMLRLMLHDNTAAMVGTWNRENS